MLIQLVLTFLYYVHAQSSGLEPPPFPMGASEAEILAQMPAEQKLPDIEPSVLIKMLPERFGRGYERLVRTVALLYIAVYVILIMCLSSSFRLFCNRKRASCVTH